MHGISYDLDVSLWICDNVTNKIYNVQTDGTLISSFATSTYDAGALTPRGISAAYKYASTGYIQTANIDAGQTPPNNGIWTLSDSTPDDSTITYAAWASDNGTFGGEETSIGAIVDQGTISVFHTRAPSVALKAYR